MKNASVYILLTFIISLIFIVLALSVISYIKSNSTEKEIKKFKNSLNCLVDDINKIHENMKTQFSK